MSDEIWNPLTAMQTAVDIVNTSPHPTNKIAASVFDDHYLIAKTNDWPESIKIKLGTEQRIGNASGTVHAEVRAILASKIPTQNLSLAITDPFCPNCAKNIAEAGIKNVYVDHKGFEKDFALRHGDEFLSMSLRIAEKAGMNVYKVERKEQQITPIFISPPDFIPREDNPIKIRELTKGNTVKDWIATNRIIHERWGAAIASNNEDKIFGLFASCHPAIGYTKDMITHDSEGKYNFYLEPLNRILMASKRYGLILDPSQIYMAQVPTARELVNYIAGGFNLLQIGDPHKGRDEDAFAALGLLQQSRIIKIF
jgi:deoxycytidylate deaminase